MSSETSSFCPFSWNSRIFVLAKGRRGSPLSGPVKMHMCPHVWHSSHVWGLEAPTACTHMHALARESSTDFGSLQACMQMHVTRHNASCDLTSALVWCTHAHMQGGHASTHPPSSKTFCEKRMWNNQKRVIFHICDPPHPPTSAWDIERCRLGATKTQPKSQC